MQTKEATKKKSLGKLKLLKLWEILNSDSDVDNPLSTAELIARLNDSGIDCDRRTLYQDIKLLNDNGYEVLCELINHSNHYYVSERGFDTAELKILMDAVTAANFITSKKTKAMHNKIAALAGSNRGELLKKCQDGVNLTKSDNEMVYYVVNELDEAILQGKQVSFQYTDLSLKGERICRRDGKRYVVNPLATVFAGERYYVIAFSDKRSSLTHYRIDRMQQVRIEQAPISNPEWLKSVSLAEHKKQLFSMYAGESVSVLFEASHSMKEVIFDRFGTGTMLKDIGSDRFLFSADVQKSPLFFGWCLSFGDALRVRKPESLVQEIKTYLKKTSSLYEDTV